MSEHDALFASYSHLKSLSRQEDALHALKRLASMVKPIMRARGWRVGQLAEFYPDQKNLLGLNVNSTHKILVRLRYPGDVNQFLPFEEVTDTLLHELAHIVHGPHDAKFHALWDQLRDEHEGLLRTGYTGDGFLSVGQRLGRGRIPMDEARRIARVAAERRKAEQGDIGRRLGGRVPRPGENIRDVIANAVSRRQASLQGCGNNEHGEGEIRTIEHTATRNGFKTQAEEDKANEDAIAQALWELVQEDEKARLGDSYVPPTAVNPELVGGGVSMPGEATRRSERVPSKRPGSSPARRDTPPLKRPAASGSLSTAAQWACDTCTLINAARNQHCQACQHSRPKQVTATTNKGLPARATATPVMIDLTQSPERNMETPTETAAAGANSRLGLPLRKPAPLWNCSHCKTSVERKWWTCTKCGKKKDGEDSQGRANKTTLGGVYANGGTYVPSLAAPAPKPSWKCLNCKTRMESKWWICSACGKMKESS